MLSGFNTVKPSLGRCPKKTGLLTRATAVGEARSLSLFLHVELLCGLQESSVLFLYSNQEQSGVHDQKVKIVWASMHI